MNIQEMSDEQLWQALKDVEDEVFRLKMEVVARGKRDHPVLFEVIGTELKKALHAPGVLSYFITEPRLVGKIPEREDLPVEPEDEVCVSIGKGKLCFESNSKNLNGTSYVRVRDEDGTEMVYWDVAEWGEDPEGVMGAIMGWITSMVRDLNDCCPYHLSGGDRRNGCGGDVVRKEGK